MSDTELIEEDSSSSTSGLDFRTEVEEQFDESNLIVDGVELSTDFLEDDDTNIGSMVSIQSEEIVGNSSDVYIIPDLPVPERNEETKLEAQDKPKSISDSWPTLEILPGGVIMNPDQVNNNKTKMQEKIENSCTVSLYSCAKCSQSFKYLYCLVQHVRWHENEKKNSEKKGKDFVCSEDDILALNKAPKDHEYSVPLHSKKRKYTSTRMKQNKRNKTPKKT